MKRTLFTFMLTLSILFAGCSKSNNENNEENPPAEESNPFSNCLVIRTERAGFKPHLFTYDEKKRLIKHQYSDFESTLTYSGNTITILNTFQGNPHYKKTVTVNAQGFATNIRLDNPNLTWSNDAFEYEGNKLVKKSTSSDNNLNLRVTRYLWEDGNMFAEHAPNGKITEYTYNKNESFQQGEKSGISELELGYVLVRNKNRLHTEKTPDGLTITHIYAEDDEGKIISHNVSYSSGISYTEAILYQCKE